ncbi:protein phosphatase 1H [Elysia marginata]|uniref:Protein phosphatase 1H n=1 Tax=Elysia marginata TaxID=1093978 RepID=A0AAV4IL88_9GAST|nr:protein phosphatase 1H [Elysia marginata]
MIDVQYFGIFDGHAGTGAALMAADQLVNHLQEKLVAIQDDLFLRLPRESTSSNTVDPNCKTITINIDMLVTGALESAFCDFDEHIAREKNMFSISGGCAAIVVLVMMDRVYVAHAGDCRAVAYIGNEEITMAREFTPMTDSERIQTVASLKPDLTYSFFSENYFLKPLTKKDLGTQVYCRQPHRRGWYYKEITEEDLAKPSLVAGQGKFARLMGTIGVTRGFGDHNLVMPGTSLEVKPFLTPIPEVRVLHLSEKPIQENDVLVVGCDGLWDLLTNEEIGASVKSSLEPAAREKLSGRDRFHKVAEDLVYLARGENSGRGWKMVDGREASFDDISVFVIPLHQCLSANRKKQPKSSTVAAAAP